MMRKFHKTFSLFLMLCLFFSNEGLANKNKPTLHLNYKDLELRLSFFKPKSFRDAVNALDKKHKGEFKKYLKNIPSQKTVQKILKKLKQRKPAALEEAYSILSFQREVLLKNPLLDFDKLMVIHRKLGRSARTAMSQRLGMPALNSHTNTSISAPTKKWDDELTVLSNLRGEIKSTPIFKPKKGYIITDPDLHFNAEKVMFSMVGSHKQWQVFEIGTDGKGLNQITPNNLKDVHHFDSCYLPNGNIIFASTAGYQGLPCEYGKRQMASLYLLESHTGKIRQLNFSQDSDWCPTVLPNGRVMYLRWEYSDRAHYFSRILMQMNPDGTNKIPVYGADSYWPNSFFNARPIPKKTSQVVGIVTGHHGISRSGRLVIIDLAKGTEEADGVVQEIPYRGRKVEPVIKDKLVNGVWPQFLQPFPLSNQYYLVSAKLTYNSLWGIYLVDTFDNMVLIKETEGSAYLDIIPLVKTRIPAVIPNRVDLEKKEATIYISDLYIGKGLRGVPKGKVKELQIYSYHFAHNRTGGHTSVGIESAWDVKRLLGTVPVEDDGSVLFMAPANTPLAILPIDEDGSAMQLFRSWFTAMPGEFLACIGCHEDRRMAPPVKRTKASVRPPSTIKAWNGYARPFAYTLEIQPILDRACVACHNGTKNKDGKTIVDFKSRKLLPPGDPKSDLMVSESYANLQRFVRRPGPESDIHTLQPMEYHSSTSELIQLLKKGHANVKLTDLEWRKLYTWIDFNAPFRGKWNPPIFGNQDQHKRRIELAKKYANVYTDADHEYLKRVKELTKQQKIVPILPQKIVRTITKVKVDGWPFDSSVVKSLKKEFTLAKNIKLEVVEIPAGKFVMGSNKGDNDEFPEKETTINKKFWMGTKEVTNAQYALFDPKHDSRYIDQQWKDHTIPGYAANKPKQPVIRISWNQAMQYCQWLSKKLDKRVTLPTEEQWEWACRAGTNTPMWYGNKETDFSKYANLADQSLKKMAVFGGACRPTKLTVYNDTIPKIMTVNDKTMLTANVGKYQVNPWGLYDMHGNVSEWTRTAYGSRTNLLDQNRKVVRGGSWRDRPYRATSSYRLPYESWQRVFNVGFRVVIEN